MGMTMNVHVQRAASALAIAGTLVGGAWLGMAAASADPFSQDTFPCQEDEVLGYAPEFGPDRVGCIHIDSISVAHGVAAADGAVPGLEDDRDYPTDDPFAWDRGAFVGGYN